MTNDLRCPDPAALAGYLYDECEPAEREAMAVHLAACATCAHEIASLRATREDLAGWTPPPAALGFRITSDAAAEAAPAAVPAPETRVTSWSRWSHVPAWAQAAAAVLLFACGATVAALMNLEIRYDQAGVTVRTGWQQAAAPARPASVPAVNVADVSGLETRIREEIRRVRSEDEGGKGVVGAPPDPNPAVRTTAAADDLIRQMRQMIAASEDRQQRELAFRVSQVLRDVDSQRRADIARIERTVVPMEGVTTEEIQQQRRMLNYLMTVSQTK